MKSKIIFVLKGNKKIEVDGKYIAGHFCDKKPEEFEFKNDVLVSEVGSFIIRIKNNAKLNNENIFTKFPIMKVEKIILYVEKTEIHFIVEKNKHRGIMNDGYRNFFEIGFGNKKESKQ